MSSNLKLQVEDLTAALVKLPANDRGFAESLCHQFRTRGLTQKQAFWVAKLLERAEAPEPAKEDVGSLDGIVELLERAQKHLKHPAVLVRAADQDFRLSLAGAAARVPGSVNVCSVGSYGDRDWFGRVTRDGKFEPSRKFDRETVTAVAAALKAMANDPAQAASDFGKLTGSCCFCGISLTDPRSTAVGYGKICAAHFGLPWNPTDVMKAAA